MADNYRLSHQAPGPERDGTTISLDQVGGRDDEVYPADVLKNPQNYGLKHPATATALEESRGNPDAEIRIWRAVPRGVTTILPGDWIAVSKEYADAEAQMESAHVISAVARARDLWSEGLLEEWGYQGKETLEATPERQGRHKVLESFPVTTSEQMSLSKETGVSSPTKQRLSATQLSDIGSKPHIEVPRGQGPLAR